MGLRGKTNSAAQERRHTRANHLCGRRATDGRIVINETGLGSFRHMQHHEGVRYGLHINLLQALQPHDISTGIGRAPESAAVEIKGVAQ